MTCPKGLTLVSDVVMASHSDLGGSAGLFSSLLVGIEERPQALSAKFNH